jgi:hypothetical protein
LGDCKDYPLERKALEHFTEAARHSKRAFVLLVESFCPNKGRNIAQKYEICQHFVSLSRYFSDMPACLRAKSHEVKSCARNPLAKNTFVQRALVFVLFFFLILKLNYSIG